MSSNRRIDSSRSTDRRASKASLKVKEEKPQQLGDSRAAPLTAWKRKLPPPKSQAKKKPKQRERSAAWVGPVTTGVNWVAVLGFPRQALAEVLRCFTDAGTILSVHHTNMGVLLHYTDRMGFAAALELDGTRIGCYRVSVRRLGDCQNALQPPFAFCHSFERVPMLRFLVGMWHSCANWCRFKFNMFVFFWWCVRSTGGR